jgi:hypothetical protein
VKYVTTNIGKEWVPIFFWGGECFATWQKEKKKKGKK